MALPAIATTVAAVESLYAAFADDKTKWGNQSAVAKLNEIKAVLNRAYVAGFTVAVTDAVDANLTAFFAGEAAAVSLLGVFRVTGTGDTLDNALAAAKGGAVAANDVFQRTGAATVAYLGSYADGVRPFDFAGETVTDFIAL